MLLLATIIIRRLAMGFVKYTKTRSRIGTPKISIWTRGQIGFNNAAIMEYDIKSYTYTTIYYNEDTGQIGIVLTNDKNEEGATKLIFRDAGGVSFSAVAFLKTYKVDYTETQQYDFEYDKGNKMFIISLDKDTGKDDDEANK